MTIINENFENKKTNIYSYQVFVDGEEFFMFLNPLNEKWTVVGVKMFINVEPNEDKSNLLTSLEVAVKKQIKKDSKITTTNGKAKFGTVYSIKGCIGEQLLLTPDESGELWYIHNGLVDNIKYLEHKKVLSELHRSCHSNDYGKVMKEYCVLS